MKTAGGIRGDWNSRGLDWRTGRGLGSRTGKKKTMKVSVKTDSDR